MAGAHRVHGLVCGRLSLVVDRDLDLIPGYKVGLAGCLPPSVKFPPRSRVALFIDSGGIPRVGGTLTELLRSYRLVSAHLFRMQDRSAVAEDAWDRARPVNMAEPPKFGQTPIRRLNAARNRAIDLIADGNHSASERTRAIVAIDEAVRMTFEVNLRDLLRAQVADFVAP